LINGNRHLMFTVKRQFIFTKFFKMQSFLFRIAIEKMTAKTGNFKPFHVFINMLENAINQVKSKEKSS